MATAKEELGALPDAEPGDCSSERLVRELALHVMVERGLADSDAGRTVSGEEIERRMRLRQAWPGPRELRDGWKTVPDEAMRGAASDRS